MASIERETEKGLLNVVSAITGVNAYTSERSGARTLPSLVIQAQIGNELIGPFTGVFKVPAIITYTEKADLISRSNFDLKFQNIINEFYRNPDLPTYLTNATSATFYLAKVTSESPRISAYNRTWSKSITLDINVTAKK